MLASVAAAVVASALVDPADLEVLVGRGGHGGQGGGRAAAAVHDGGHAARLDAVALRHVARHGRRALV